MSQFIIDSRNNLLSETSFVSTSQSLKSNTKENNLLNMNDNIINTTPENIGKEGSQELFESTQSFTNLPDLSMSPNRRHRLFNTELTKDSNNYQEVEDLDNAKNSITFGEDVVPNISNESKISGNKESYPILDNNVLTSFVMNDIWRDNLQQASSNPIQSSNHIPVESSIQNSFNLFQNDPKNVESYMMIQRLLNQTSKNSTILLPKKHNSLPTANLLYETPPIVTRSAKSFDYNSSQDINEKSLMELIMQHNARQKGSGNAESSWPLNSQYAQNSINDNLIKQWSTLNGDLAINSNFVSTHDNQYNTYSSHPTNASSNFVLNSLYNYPPPQSTSSGHVNYNANSTPFHINFPKQPHHHSQNAQHGVNINQASHFQHRASSNLYPPKSTVNHFPSPNKHPTHFQHQGLNSMRPITGAHPGKRGSHNIFGSYSHQSITNMPKTPPAATLNADAMNSLASKSGGYDLDRATLLLALNAGKNPQGITTSSLPSSKVSLFNLKQKYEEALREQHQQQLGLSHHNQYPFNEKGTEPLHFDFQQHNLSDLSSNVSPFEKDGQPISPLLLAATKERFERQRFPSCSSATSTTPTHQQLPHHHHHQSHTQAMPKHHQQQQQQQLAANNSNYFDINNANQYKDPMCSLKTNSNDPSSPLQDKAFKPNLACSTALGEAQDSNPFSMSSLEEQILTLIGSSGNPQAHPFALANNPRPIGNLISSPIDSLLSAVAATSKGAIGSGLFDDQSHHHHIKGELTAAPTGSDSGLDLDTSFSPPFMLSPLNAAAPTHKLFGGVGTIGGSAHYPHFDGTEAEFGEKYSRKVFVGGLPPDIDEGDTDKGNYFKNHLISPLICDFYLRHVEEITNSFRGFGYLVVDWPHKAESKSYFPPKGYAFLLFQEEASVQSLMEACYTEHGKHYLYVSSPTIKDKPVQIRAWNLGDADFVLDASQPLDPRKTIFVGGVPRPLRAVELALIMDRLYGNVCYAGIDTDPELKYPKGAGRVAFSTKQSYIAAISARFVQLQHADIDKRVEVKPYVLDDQNCDECNGMRCMGKYAPFFCANVACLKYYCELCWATVHTRPGKEFHKPLVKEGGDRPRTLPFRLY